MRKFKKQIGIRLIHKLTHQVCTISELTNNNFTVEFDNGTVKSYSLSSLDSKFNLYDKASDEDVQKQNDDPINGQIGINYVGEQQVKQVNTVQKLDNEHEQMGNKTVTTNLNKTIQICIEV